MKDILSHYDMEKTILLLRGSDCYYVMSSLDDIKFFKADPNENVSIN